MNFLCGAMRKVFGSWDIFQDSYVIVKEFIIKFRKKNIQKIEI